MTNPSSDASLQRTARVAGLLYLILAVCCLFSTMFVDAKLYVPGDAAATADNILANEPLFRLGIVSSLIGMVAFLFLANAFYKLLNSVDVDQARLMLIMVVASVAIACLNLVSQFMPVLILNGSGFEPALRDALTMLFLDMHKYGVYVNDIFWGLWLIPLGILIYRSGFFPRVLGVLITIGSLGYLATCLKSLLLPDNGALAALSPALLMVSMVAEFAFVFWLLLKGVNIHREDKPLRSQPV